MPVCSSWCSALENWERTPTRTDWERAFRRTAQVPLFFRAFCNLQLVPIFRKQFCADRDNKAAHLMFSLFYFLYLVSELADLYLHHLVIRRAPARGQECPFCLQWEYHEEDTEVLEKGSLTSVIESRGSAHSPLSLIHSCCAGAAHLNADVCNLLGLQGPDHHHVYVAKLVSPDILQTNPRGPCLCPWD